MIHGTVRHALRKAGWIGMVLMAMVAPGLGQQTQTEEMERRAKVLSLLPNNAAKRIFGTTAGPAPLQPRAIGSFARGCLAGARALPVDGETWQVMRLSRNRMWGHPELISWWSRLRARPRVKPVGMACSLAISRSPVADRCSLAMPRTRSVWMPISG